MDGKADWMAFGLPVEGEDGPFLGSRIEPVATCEAGGTVADARRALDGSENGVVVVVAGDGLAVGQVDAGALDGSDAGRPLLDLLAPVPSTVRPSVTVAALAGGGGGRRLVTTSDGRLLGQATAEADDHDEGHEGHDHEGHDDDGHDHVALERELTEVMEAVAAHFAGRDPGESEVRAFLVDRLVGEGMSAEDAERALDDAGGAPGS
ncbi:MAG: hypothetical protein ABR511_12740 [Acidimicrobiales bacterium]